MPKKRKTNNSENKPKKSTKIKRNQGGSLTIASHDSFLDLEQEQKTLDIALASMTADQHERIRITYDNITKYAFDTFEKYRDSLACRVYNEQDGFRGYASLECELASWRISTKVMHAYFKRHPRRIEKDRTLIVEALSGMGVYLDGETPDGISSATWKELTELYDQFAYESVEDALTVQGDPSQRELGSHCGQAAIESATGDHEWLTKDQAKRIRTLYVEVGSYRFETFESFKADLRRQVYSQQGFLGHKHVEEEIEKWSIFDFAVGTYFATRRATKKDYECAVEALERIEEGNARPKNTPRAVWERLMEIYVERKEYTYEKSVVPFKLRATEPGHYRGRLLADGEDWMSDDQNERCKNIYTRFGTYMFNTFERFKQQFRWVNYCEATEHSEPDHLLEVQFQRWSIMASAHQAYFERKPTAGQRERELVADVLREIDSGEVRPEDIPRSVWQPIKEAYLQEKKNFVKQRAAVETAPSKSKPGRLRRDSLTDDQENQIRTIFDGIGDCFGGPLEKLERDVLLDANPDRKIASWKRIAAAHQHYFQRVSDATREDRRLVLDALIAVSMECPKPDQVPVAVWKQLKKLYSEA